MVTLCRFESDLRHHDFKKRAIGIMSDCIFCKIINKEISSEIIDENEHVIVFKDLNPKGPIHYLIVPKIHIENVSSIDDSDEHCTAVREMFSMIRKLAKNLPEPKAFTLISNNGKESGQTVFHMHWHLITGLNPAGKSQ